MRATLFALAIALLMAPGSAKAHASGPTGVWLTQKGDAHVRVAPCGGALCGTIVWLREPLSAHAGRQIPQPSLMAALATGAS